MASPEHQYAAEIINAGQAILGCELGSTRIKASLIGPGGQALASGSFGWGGVASLPIATDDTLGSGKWEAGPMIMYMNKTLPKDLFIAPKWL